MRNYERKNKFIKNKWKEIREREKEKWIKNEIRNEMKYNLKLI